jgi:hypothetical protein
MLMAATSCISLTEGLGCRRKRSMRGRTLSDHFTMIYACRYATALRSSGIMGGLVLSYWDNVWAIKVAQVRLTSTFSSVGV